MCKVGRNNQFQITTRQDESSERKKRLASLIKGESEVLR